MTSTYLTELARDGDRTALTELLRQAEPDLRRFAARVCRSSADADDAVAHAMLTITVKLASFRGLSRFSTWLFAVVRNECRRYERLARRWLSDVDADQAPDESASPEHSGDRAKLIEALVAAIRDLPSDLREVLVLREFEGLSTELCAARLSITEGNVRVRLNRARAQLRRTLADLR
jgi:RNA polymerase sigma factor (sigma-70 family)